MVEVKKENTEASLEFLGSLFPKSNRRTLEALKSYIRRHDLHVIIRDFYDNPGKGYKESILKEKERGKLRILRRIGITDYRVLDVENQGGSLQSVLEKGVQDYVWVFTPENVNLKPLEETSDYVNPLTDLLEDMNEHHVNSQSFAIRMRMIKSKIANLGDLTNEQTEKLQDLALTIYDISCCDGKCEDGDRVMPEELLYLFSIGLKEIKINSPRKKYVYSPAEDVEPESSVPILEEVETVERGLEELKKMMPPVVKNPKPEIKEPLPIAPEDDEFLEKEEPLKVRTRKRRIRQKNVIKKPKNSFGADVLKEMLPGLMEYRDVEVRAPDVIEIPNTEKINSLGKTEMETDLGVVVPLPSYLYGQFAQLFGTSEADFKKVYEERMRAYVDDSRNHANILKSQAFYQIAKLLPTLGPENVFGEEELSGRITTLKGDSVSSKVIREKIKPFVEIGLISCNSEKYRMNKKFLEKI